MPCQRSHGLERDSSSRSWGLLMPVSTFDDYLPLDVALATHLANLQFDNGTKKPKHRNGVGGSMYDYWTLAVSVRQGSLL